MIPKTYWFKLWTSTTVNPINIFIKVYKETRPDGNWVGLCVFYTKGIALALLLNIRAIMNERYTKKLVCLLSKLQLYRPKSMAVENYFSKWHRHLRFINFLFSFFSFFSFFLFLFFCFFLFFFFCFFFLFFLFSFNFSREWILSPNWLIWKRK